MAPLRDWFGGKKPEKPKAKAEGGGTTPERTGPEVKVTEISLEHAKAPRSDVDLGARTNQEREIERNVGGLLGGLQRNAKRAFKLEWEGNKVPRGTVVGGHTIAWTQNGQVLDEQGKMIGTYERTIEFGGDSGKKQEMLVFLLD